MILHAWLQTWRTTMDGGMSIKGWAVSERAGATMSMLPQDVFVARRRDGRAGTVTVELGSGVVRDIRRAVVVKLGVVVLMMLVRRVVVRTMLTVDAHGMIVEMSCL